MTTALGAASSPVLWYVARGSGAVALVLLTLSLVGGIVTSVRWSSERLPRFVIQLLHRNISLLTVVFIVIHIATIVVDGFAPIGWIDAVLPFRSGYRPLWLGLGAIAFDLVLALIVTSLLRHRIGQRTWRVVHWSAYLCWPLVVVHGLGSGSDTRSDLMLGTMLVCVVLVLLAVWWRLAQGWPDHAGARVAGVIATLAAPLLLVAWLGDGPLASGWAARAGTPTAILGGRGPAVATQSASEAVPAPSALPSPPFSASVAGGLTRQPSGNGRVTLDLALRLSGGASGDLTMALGGQPTSNGGVLMDTSRVRLVGDGGFPVYDGHVTVLDGNRVVATLRDSSGQAITLTADIRIDEHEHLTGAIRVDPEHRGGGEREEQVQERGD